jgi:hypothetical protein
MENPTSWNDDVKAVYQVIDDYNKGLAGGIVGYSLSKLIEVECIAPLRKHIKQLERQVRNESKKRIAKLD